MTDCVWRRRVSLLKLRKVDATCATYMHHPHVLRAEKQYCEEYKASELQREFGLSRDRLALLALLLGSDYTEGIAGIGIVNAMETLHVYPTVDSLTDFKEWLDSPDYERFEPMGKRAAKARAAAGAARPLRLRACFDLRMGGLTRPRVPACDHRRLSRAWWCAASACSHNSA